MNVEFDNRAIKEMKIWKKKNPKIINTIEELIQDILENGLMHGKGKPERLKYGAGYSRRISEEHRLVYYSKNNVLYIVSCSNHY
jgi:toxin YoeB